MDVNITINVGEDGDVTAKGLPIKKKTKKLQNGKEVILEMPEAQENTNPKPGILNMMGI
ncbi:MAG: hypothetical protein U9O94_04895 [Nanoarchaeota archaeon]|nr:hypothetical protein [Nanoarchaeota archaeon]